MDEIVILINYLNWLVEWQFMEGLRVLVASPVYAGMKYCFSDFVNHVKKIEGVDYDFLVVDNSRTKDFYEEIRHIRGLSVFYDDTGEEKNMMRVVHSRNVILDYAIENGYDYLLMLDCDVMVPANVLIRLLGHGKDIVSGLYFNIFNIGGQNKLLPVAYKAVPEKVFEKVMASGRLPSFVKSPNDLRVNITAQDIEAGGGFGSALSICRVFASFSQGIF